MNQKNDIQWDFGVFIVLGLLGAGVGIDLMGRLVSFLYSESTYFMIGFIFFAFMAAVVCVAIHFSSALDTHQAEVEKRLTEYRSEFSDVKTSVRSTNSKYEVIKRSLEEHWKLCEKTINKAEELLNPKPPVITPVPEEPHEDEIDVQEAVEEVVGGAL